MKSEPKKLSQIISEICAFLDTSVKDYNYNYEQVQVMDKLTQDYLHKLELDGLDYRERAKVATRLADCRKKRRAYKDETEILQPLVDFLQTDKGRTTLNLLKEVLGKTRKAEEKQERRIYFPRVLKEENKG